MTRRRSNASPAYPPADRTRGALLWHARPVGYMAWSGVEQHSNATQIARAIGLLYALTGSYDAPGRQCRICRRFHQADVAGR